MLILEYADISLDSFTFPVGANLFEKSSASPDRNGFSKASVEDINTSFANDAGPNQWQFSAGTGEDEANAAGARSSAARPLNRRAPIKRPSKLHTDNVNDAFPAPQAETESNAEDWGDKSSTQTFVPPPAPGPSLCTNSKKSKTRPTAGTAAVVVDISSDEESYKLQGRNRRSGSLDGVPSMSQAMDIDSPSSTCNVPVEQLRPEWRADGAGAPEPSAGDGKPARHAAGSEDSSSFAGLKGNLPFESKEPDVQPLQFPAAPEAPQLPPTTAVGRIEANSSSWKKYVQDFGSYLRQWHTFNHQVVGHFDKRKALIKSIKEAEWYRDLLAQGDAAALQKYHSEVMQDNNLRERWTAACVDHENRLREFTAYRNKTK